MKPKFLPLLALPLIALFAIPATAEAGYRYGGYHGGYGYGFGHRSPGYSSRYRSAAFDYYNGGRGHFRDSGHTNYRTYRVYRNYDLKAKSGVPSARAVAKGNSSGLRSIFKSGRR